MRRLPPLNALRLFEASARHLSFKDAAEELRLTPSAVSHGIQSLEQWLGTPLFVRTAKGLVLTQAGVNYFPVVRSALEALVDGSEQVTKRQQHQLNISAAPTFASRFLLPLLAEFRCEHPEISVTVDTSRELAPLGDGGVDIAVRRGHGEWPGTIANELLRERLVPVCAPKRLHEFKKIRDLDRAPLIHVTTVSDDWTLWARAAGRELPHSDGGLCFDTLQMAFDAAAEGLGVAIGRRPLVDAELSSGALVKLWEPEILSDAAYWLVAPERQAARPAIRTFFSWVAARPIASIAPAIAS